MSNCCICGSEITDKNVSEEHIFLNALGGKLKSKTLICRDCNSTFGNKFDAMLAKQLQPFAVLLNVDRDKGETPPIEATRISNGEKIMISPGGKPLSAKPKVELCNEDGKQTFHVIARSQEELDKIYKGIKNKHPTAYINETGNHIEEINELVNIEFDLGGQSFLSVCKTAICYFLHIGGAAQWVETIIERFKKNDVLDFCNFCYVDEVIIKRSDQSIYHSIAVVGDKNTKLLYSYIELFNFYRVIVLLNDNYGGTDIRECYSYDLVKKEVAVATTGESLTKERIDNILKQELRVYGPKLVKALNDTKNEIEMKNTVDKVFRCVCEKYKSSYPDGIPSDLFAKEFSEGLVKEMMPYIKRGHEKKC